VNVPPSWIEKKLAPELQTDDCFATDVTQTKEKCAISRLIFRKFSRGYAPRPHTGEGLRRPTPDLTPSALRRFTPPRLARELQSLHRRVLPL